MAPADAVAGTPDGATVLIGGFGEAGSPTELIHALIDQGARELTVVANNAGNGRIGLARLLAERRVAKLICSYPRSVFGQVFAGLYREGQIKLDVVPQGTLAERIRAGGAGIGGFYTPTAADSILAEGREVRMIDGRAHLFETPIRADLALVKALRADMRGNLVYSKTGRNFGPVMCMAATVTVVQVREIVPVGALDPEAIVTPSLFVDRLVEVAAPVSERAHLAELAGAPA